LSHAGSICIEGRILVRPIRRRRDETVLGDRGAGRARIDQEVDELQRQFSRESLDQAMELLLEVNATAQRRRSAFAVLLEGEQLVWSSSTLKSFTACM
jgi:hypothetical protein